jgi:sugar lactone lactonase YvrE
MAEMKVSGSKSVIPDPPGGIRGATSKGRRSATHTIAGIAAAALAGVIAYLCFWPVPVEPVSWSALPAPGFIGAYAPNTRLADLRTIDLGNEVGPEHIAIGADGKLYAAMLSGNLIRLDQDGGKREVFANTGGRVLGFDFDAQGRMIAADAMKGLLAITADRRVTVLTDHVTPGDPIRYADAVVVAPDGTIYFTDASTRFSPAAWGGSYQASLLDIIEQSATGRVLAYDPVSGRTRIVAHGLSFANGIALSSDGHTLLVNETGRYRIWKIDGRANDLNVQSGSPQARILIDNLPGYPDNLMSGRDGRIWVGLFRPRNPAADSLAERPFVRKILLRLPRFLLPLGKPYGHVFAIDEDGRVTIDLQDPSGAYPETTGATETADRLYIQSLHAPTIGWLPRASVIGRGS